MKMNVLEVISSLKPVGGAETFAVNFCVSLSKKVNLYVAILYDDFTNSLVNTLKNNGINFTFFHKKKGIDFKCAKLLSKFIIDNKIEYIHTENNALITTYLALRKNKQCKRIPVLHTIHTVPGLEGGRISNLFMKHIFRNKIATPVNIIADDNVKNYYKLSYVPVVENGIDLSRFDSSIPLDKRTSDLVMLARFSEEKNHIFAIDVLGEVIKKIPSFSAYLYGFGELKETIQNLIKSKSLENNIHVLDSVPNEEVPNILKKAKISLLTSLREMKSLSIIEALASGCILVVNDCVGNRTIIENDNNGYLVSIDDKNKYVNRIVDIVTNPSKYKKISQNAVASSKQYSIDKCVKNYLNIFKGMN